MPSIPPARAWLGMIAVTVGVVIMIAGVSGVYLYAKRQPPVGPLGSASAPLPPPLAVAPPPAVRPRASAPPPSAGIDSVPPPLPAPPFPDDRNAAVPVERGQPLWGPRDAPVTLTLFGDLQCPHTVALLRPILAEKAKRGDALRLAFRHLPMSQHAEGTRAALVLTEIHTLQGEASFWRVVREIARRGEPLDEGTLEPVLAALGIQGFPLESAPPGVEERLQNDAVLAVRLFVHTTPTVFVNGERLAGFQTERVLSDTIERELRAVRLMLASGVKPSLAYGERVRKNLINLGEEPPLRACVPVGDSPVRGAAAPLVTIVEFSDLECELCRTGELAVARSLAAHAREVRTAWKHFPLPQHRRARTAAGFALEARRTAGDKAFWSVVTALLEPGAAPDEQGLARAAGRARLEAAALLKAGEQGTHEARIEADIRLGEELGVTGAPTYFVNGRKVPGALPPLEFEALVQKELALARKVRSQARADVAELACPPQVASAGQGDARSKPSSSGP